MISRGDKGLCQRCGGTFIYGYYYAKRYCSKSCELQGNKRNPGTNGVATRFQKGSKPSNYKGWKLSSGYKYIRVGNTYVAEHRLVMEKHINRKLTKTEVIHHLNGDKLDNRIENLQLMKNQALHVSTYHKSCESGKRYKTVKGAS